MIDFTALKTLATKFTVTGAQKAHIDRLVFELGVQEKEAVKTIEKSSLLEAENTALKERIAALELEVLNLNSKLAAVNECEEIDDQAFQILEALFNNGPCMELPTLAGSFNLQEGEVEYFLDELRKRDFIEKHPVIFGAMGMTPVTSCILPAGRAFVMKRKSNN